jgi:predicted CXXCH cytochrome family protein
MTRILFFVFPPDLAAKSTTAAATRRHILVRVSAPHPTIIWDLLSRAGARRRLLALGLVAALVLLATSTSARGAASDEADACLQCHADEKATLALENGESAPLFMKRELLAASVHKNLRCTDCHAGFDRMPHPERHYKDLNHFRTSLAESCKTCHFENYTKTLDSVHYGLQARGDVFAPTCVKCHGSHDIAKPAEPRSRISQTCATCHRPISETYAKSVHGKALLADNNPDVPVCTDCHRSHNIADPKSRAWLMSTPALCGRCHADPKRMGKYGLSTNVLGTYLSDFHGTTASFGGKGKKTDNEPVVALCVDCHGIHDIAKVTGDSAPVFRANLVKTCRKCHPGASDNFPAAWLSHYEPSLQRAPLVFLVKLFYKLIIPFIVGGLILQILLHLWRTVVNR